MELLGLAGLGAALAALGFLELFAIGVLFLLLVVGCTVDRRFDNESFKWWVVVGGVALSVFWFWSPLREAGFGGIWDAVSTLSFWMPAVTYFGIGLLYCIPEFMMDVRRAATFYRDAWQRFLDTSSENTNMHDGAGVRTKETQKVTARTAISKARELTGTGTEEERDFRRAAEHMVSAYLSNHRYRNRIVQVQGVKDDSLAVEPVINKVELAEHVAAWTIFWPFYLIALVIGDLLTEVWKAVADFLTTFAGRFVKMTFSDVFKLN